MTEIATSVHNRIIALEQVFLDRCLPHYFGYHLVHYANTNTDQSYNLDSSTIKHRVLLSDNKNIISPSATTLHTNFCALPFANNSVDVVFMPHVLETVDKPRVVIDEACRTVIPYGHIIILGYNRWSLLGAMTARAQTADWMAAARIRRWLAYQSFEMIFQDYCFYSLPCGSTENIDPNHWMEKVGHIGWRYFGGVYCLVARKCIATVTMLKPAWQRSRAIRASCSAY